jgi:hypothetical protein
MEQTKLDVKLYIQPNSSYQMEYFRIVFLPPPGYDLSQSTRLPFPLTYVPA